MSAALRSPFSRTALLGVIAVLFLAGHVAAESGFLNTWQSIYPTSLSDNNVIAGTGFSCQLCHRDVFGGNNFNAYGWRIRQFKNAGQSTSNAIISAGALDSDADPTGSTNAVEIAANTQPGWTDGPHNTTYTGSGSTQTNQLPPSGINGDLDPPLPTWVDLGDGLAGTNGTPVLSGSGDLSGGSPVGLTLTNALPGAPAYLIMSLATLNAPFKGGVLVPDPSAPLGLFFPLAADGAGNLTIGGLWPVGIPTGTVLYNQYWITDAGGPKGFAASNALSGTTP